MKGIIINLQRIQILRSILSARLLLCSILISLIVIATISSFLSSTYGSIDLLGMGLTGAHGNLMLVLGTLPLIPFTLSFASEWQERAVFPWVMRTGVTLYTLSKFLFSAISAFLTTVVGLVLVVVLLTLWFPLNQGVYIEDAYSVYVENNELIRYLVIYISHVALSSSIFAMIAFFVSTVIPQPIVVLASPAVFYFVWHRITSTLSIPGYLRALYIFESIYDAGSPLRTFGLKLMIALIIALPLSYLSVYCVKRRVAHG
ncbi:hypothetical protein [Amphibacillus jilinensis]|uniref:hypothetical protein n=1 Tax=Amphibacillus jilinensis TaxID=1216008 RepID=UPI000314FB52|nr:hypothetical protein [Amphibacillus jilinensis]